MSSGIVERTYWVSVIVLFLAGCSVALHMGKVPLALPILRETWDLSLTRAGLIVSVFTVLVAVLGLPLGLLVERVGNVRFTVIGIAVAGIGSLLGAATDNLTGLLLTRAVEGLGWIITAVSLPSILTTLSTLRDRPLVLGIWGAFVPIGAGVMLLAAPVLQGSGGWSLSWHTAGIASIVGATLVLLVTQLRAPALTSLGAARDDQQSGRLFELKKPAVWLISLTFFIYSFQYLPVVSFLPTLFLESSSLPLASLSYLTAIVILTNATGNFAAGIYLRRGVSHQKLLTFAFISMGIATFVLYIEVFPFPLRVFAAILFSSISGLIPGTLFALVPRIIDSPDGTAPVIGLMLQMSGIAQLFGAVVLPFAVEAYTSWVAAGIVTLMASLVGLVIARSIRIRG